MDETGPDLKTVQSENDATIARLAAIDPGLGIQAAQLSQTFYLQTLMEHALRFFSGERGLETARLAHQTWLSEQLEQTESQVRQRMLSTIGNGGAPSSPFPNREARRHPA